MLVKITKRINEPSRPTIFARKISPLQAKHAPMASDMTGFSYMLVSKKDWTTLYIGQALNLGLCINQHNSGYGSKQTTNPSKGPWMLYGYVCGFRSEKDAMFHFETLWRNRTKYFISNGSISVESIAGVAEQSIKNSDFGNSNLKFIC